MKGNTPLKRYFSLFTLLLVLVGCGESQENRKERDLSELASKIIFPKNVTDKERKLLLNAIGYMVTYQCSNMLGYQRSIEHMEVEHLTGTHVYDWARERYGWTELFIFKPKIKAAPQIGLADAKGHTLHIFLGIGSRSGIYKSKEVGLEICGFDSTRFIDTPGLNDILSQME